MKRIGLKEDFLKDMPSIGVKKKWLGKYIFSSITYT